MNILRIKIYPGSDPGNKPKVEEHSYNKELIKDKNPERDQKLIIICFSLYKEGYLYSIFLHNQKENILWLQNDQNEILNRFLDSISHEKTMEIIGKFSC